MSDEKTIQQWGYSKNHIEDGAKIFDLKEGEGLPEGYYDHPSKVPADKPEKPVLKLPADKEPDAPKVSGL